MIKNHHIISSRDSIGGNSNVTEPKVLPRSARTPNRPGRKIVNTISSHLLSKKDSAKAKEKSTENASIEELDQMLEDDALVLLNMRKDITNSQKEELVRLKNSVMTIKKEYDTIHVANNLKESQLKGILDKQIALRNVEAATHATTASVEDIKASLEQQASIVLEEYDAEQRTIKMQNLMIKRLEKEIGQCRLDTSKAVLAVDQIKHDVALTETALHNSRQEVIDLEMQLEKLNSTLKARKDQRESKLRMLTNLSQEGENSMARMQSTANETARRLEMTSRQRARQQQASRNIATRDSRIEEDEFAEFTDPTGTKKKLSIAQVRDMAQRYLSQAARMERLRQLDTELRATIVLQQKKKNEFSEHLAHTVFRIQQLASSRQIYQEVDLKDSALAATSKECEDCKDREFRLKLSIESLKQAIPRFLMKVTKVAHPKPTENQLSDAILKLEDEVTKLIKTIGSALLKDATPEDLALMSQLSAASGGNDSNSEFARLQRLPGFSRLQRQLFYNLMTARPDVSQQNIRIEHVRKVKEPRTTFGPSSHFEDTDQLLLLDTSRKFGRGSLTAELDEKMLHNIDSEENLGQDDEEPALGRATIKSISKLIYERDHNKPITAPTSASDF